MGKVRDKAKALKLFRCVFIKAVANYEEDERDGVPRDERRRARWNKEDIMRICEWERDWQTLRNLLESRVGLIMLRKGAPRADLCFTFATCERDRVRSSVNAIRVSLGQTARSGNVLNNQIAPSDERHAITKAGRDQMDDELREKNGTNLHNVIQAIEQVRTDLLRQEVLQLTSGNGGFNG